MTWSLRYLLRLLGRNPGRCLLSLLLAALLAFAFGLLAVLRSVYAEAYRKVDVRALFVGGLPYASAQKLEKSGMVREPYYEYVNQDCEIEFQGKTTLCFLNNMSRYVREETDWLEGWDEAAFSVSDAEACVMTAGTAAAMGFGLGDPVRVEETDYLSGLMGDLGLTHSEEEYKEAVAIRDQRRPKLQLAGLIRSESRDNTLYIPVAAWRHFSWISNQLILDLAEYTLTDYHRAGEFSEYAGEVLSHVQSIVKLELDTSYADRIYKIHQLIETLYPLAVAAALLLGGVLPGLTVLHASGEISILRALGVKSRKCVGIYALAQVLCALVGLLLGLALVILIQRPEFSTVLRPFVLYLLAHLAACALGSGIFAWLCARKRVLEQLQAKE